MAFQAIYALHKDVDGKILDAGAFDYSFKLSDWLKSLDVQPGDIIEFGERASRKEPLTIVEPAPEAEGAAA